VLQLLNASVAPASKIVRFSIGISSPLLAVAKPTR